MASSRKRPSADPAAAARRAIGPLGLGGRGVAVGLSGGVDSVVLLFIMRALAAEFGIQLSAIHVNHGISANARRWERFCAGLCRRWKVPLTVRRVRVQTDGEGLEAAARRVRREAYAALPVDAIALGHHLDDQAETVLHNLLRGTGLRGASGMPVAGRLGAKRVIRPLLDVPREAILAFARHSRLEWIEDESNSDIALTRNWLRREIGPLAAKRFPRWRENLARAARHFAAKDLERGDLLREFLAQHGLRAPSEARLGEMLRQLGSKRAGARTAIRHDGTVVRVYKGALRVTRAGASAPFAALPWRGESRLKLDALGGELRFRRARGGIDPASIPRGGLTVNLRRGGERLQPDAKRPRRTLKNLFQEAGVPAWERGRLPLLFRGARLVWAPGLGVDAAYRAAAGRRGWLPEWLPA